MRIAVDDAVSVLAKAFVVYRFPRAAIQSEHAEGEVRVAYLTPGFYGQNNHLPVFVCLPLRLIRNFAYGSSDVYEKQLPLWCFGVSAHINFPL